MPLFIVVTMRSEYLGDCAQHPGLAEALSEAQYLIPRLTRDQREEAIRGPVDMAGGQIEDALVQQLLNDAGEDPDQLPALQHALMRLWSKSAGVLSIDDYSEELRVGRSLNYHAQSIFNDFSPEQQKLAEKVFRCLTTTEKGREGRRPTKLGAIYKIVGAASEEAQADVRQVIREFSRKENSLLFASTGAYLSEDTLVDITHESLIRQWDLLQEWVRREAGSAEWFSVLVRAAELKSDLWGKRDTELVSGLLSEEGWNSHWGDQYRPGFDGAVTFLAASRAAIEAQEEERRQRARELEEVREQKLEIAQRGRKRLTIALAGLTAAVLGLLAFAGLFWQERQQRIRALEIQLHAVAGAGRVNPADGQRYVYIPAGKFMMGCSEGDTECQDDEKPRHEVEITHGFWMGQTEVTQSAYQKVMKTNPSFFKGADRPVEQVRWDDATKYCQAVGMRLPTEAEWEYAARAGSTQARYGDLDQIAWYSGNSKGSTQPVAAKYPNGWGLYDTLGNVWEWTADWYDPKYYDQKVVKDPQGPASSPEGRRVLRGGSWLYDPGLVRASFRDRIVPEVRYLLIGFRCAGELP